MGNLNGRPNEYGFGSEIRNIELNHRSQMSSYSPGAGGPHMKTQLSVKTINEPMLNYDARQVSPIVPKYLSPTHDIKPTSDFLKYP